MRRAIACLLTLLCVGCDCGDGEIEAPPPPDVPPVFASNYPGAFFSERLLGSAEAVSFPAMDGDPAFWSPSREQIRNAQHARLIVFNGATYERWEHGVSLPTDRIVRSSRAFRADWIEVSDTTTHSHGPKGPHDHAGTAFTTWIDFAQAGRQLAAIRDAVIRAELAPKGDVDTRHDTLAAELKSLDDELLAVTRGGGDIPVVASHPVYQYLARRYGLKLKAVLWEPETDPGEAGWKALDTILVSHPARWMIWEGDPLPATVAKLEKRGIRSVVFDPCGNRPDEGDFISVMKANIQNLRPIFGK